jgi:LysM repeat protein
MARSRRDLLLRWAAPAAFVAVVTVVVLVIHAGLGGNGGGGTSVTTTPPSPIVSTQSTRTATRRARKPARYYTVQSGDTFGAIAAKEGTTVQRLEQLNPGVSSNSLQVGQKIRVG